MTMMLGGVIGGYWASGKLGMATSPASAITIDSTEAKIGRSMKKCENILACKRESWTLIVQQPHQRRARRRRGRLHLRIDRRPLAYALHAADDDLLALNQALLALVALLGRLDRAQL